MSYIQTWWRVLNEARHFFGNNLYLNSSAMTRNKQCINFTPAYLSLFYKHLLALVKHTLIFFEPTYIGLECGRTMCSFIIYKQIHKILPSIVTYLCAKVCFFLYCPSFHPLWRHSANKLSVFLHWHTDMALYKWRQISCSSNRLYPHELACSFTTNDTKDSIKEKEGEVHLTSY